MSVGNSFKQKREIIPESALPATVTAPMTLVGDIEKEAIYRVISFQYVASDTIQKKVYTHAFQVGERIVPPVTATGVWLLDGIDSQQTYTSAQVEELCNSDFKGSLSFIQTSPSTGQSVSVHTVRYVGHEQYNDKWSVNRLVLGGTNYQPTSMYLQGVSGWYDSTDPTETPISTISDIQRDYVLKPILQAGSAYLAGVVPMIDGKPQATVAVLKYREVTRVFGGVSLTYLALPDLQGISQNSDEIHWHLAEGMTYVPTRGAYAWLPAEWDETYIPNIAEALKLKPFRLPAGKVIVGYGGNHSTAHIVLAFDKGTKLSDVVQQISYMGLDALYNFGDATFSVPDGNMLLNDHTAFMAKSPANTSIWNWRFWPKEGGGLLSGESFPIGSQPPVVPPATASTSIVYGQIKGNLLQLPSDSFPDVLTYPEYFVLPIAGAQTNLSNWP